MKIILVIYKNDVSEVGEYATLSIPSMTQLKEMYHEHGMIKKNLEMLIIANKEKEIVGMIQRVKQQSYRFYRQKARWACPLDECRYFFMQLNIA